MISGRGLGHTGGTLDKLDAIPGYRTAVSGEELARVVGSTGCAIVGAGEGIAPGGQETLCDSRRHGYGGKRRLDHRFHSFQETGCRP